jgi:DNA-binding response OmpR family regulator
MKVLIVEDDRKLASFLARAFSEEGFVVDACRTGAEAIAQSAKLSYDLVVLDWMLPEQDGLSVCRELRRTGNSVPILMLTARSEVGEKVLALDAGADDYLTKPFHLDELMARSRSLTRRGSSLREPTIRVGPLTVDIRERRVHVDGRRVDVTGREFSLLSLLARSAGRVVTRTEILSQVWEIQHDPGSNVVDVHVRNLREKLGIAAPLLETVRGQGYRMTLVEPAASA